eukprot:275063-Pelagomonas_calceolata.AAC.2
MQRCPCAGEQGTSTSFIIINALVQCNTPQWPRHDAQPGHDAMLPMTRTWSAPSEQDMLHDQDMECTQ